MTNEAMATLLAQLQRKLGLGEPSEEESQRLEDALAEAESEMLLYLNVETLESRYLPKVAELAALYYRRENLNTVDGAKATSVTEGGLSQSVTYLSPEDWQRQEQAIFASIARYRRVTL